MSARAVAIGLGVVCAILAVALAYTLFSYNVILLGANREISLLQSQIGDLQNQINALNTQISNLQTQGGGTTSSQVQVSGTLRNKQSGTIYFLETPWDRFVENVTVRTSSPIINGEYGILLVGGKSYDIFFDEYPSYWDEDPDYVLYVPSGVTAFTADF